MIEKFKNLDSKFSWSFMGFLIGIIGIVLTVYTVFIFEPTANLSFSVLTNTDVVNMRENVSNLKILYDDNVIDNRSLSLKLLTFQVKNTGNKDILLGDYDPEKPISFYVENGQVVDSPILISASNNYLKESIKITNIDNEFVLPKLIIENGEEFTIKLLVLTIDGEVPVLKAKGKIAGLREIEVLKDTSANNNDNNYIVKIFNGNLIVQVLRVIAYTFICIVLIGMVVFVSTTLHDFITKRKKHRILNNYKKSKKYKNDDNSEIVFELYKNYDINLLDKVLEIIKNQDLLNKTIKNIKTHNNSNRYKRYMNERSHGLHSVEYDYIDFEHRILDGEIREEMIIKKIIEKNKVNFNENEYKVEKKFLDVFESFMNYASILTK